MVTNFTTFPHILKGYLCQRSVFFSFLCADSRQILSCEYNSKGNLMSISVRLYYDFIWLNGRNRRTLHLVRKSLKSHCWLALHRLSQSPRTSPLPTDNIQNWTSISTWQNLTPFQWSHVAAVGLKRFCLASCHTSKKSRFCLLLLLRLVIETWVKFGSSCRGPAVAIVPLSSLLNRWRIHL